METNKKKNHNILLVHAALVENSELDIHLRSIKNRQEYIRSLVKEDMIRNGEAKQK